MVGTAPTSTDCVSYYKFDTNNATQPDSVGSYNGSVTGASYTASGKINGAYDFDGTDDIVSISNDFCSGTGDFSISLWADFDSDANGYLVGTIDTAAYAAGWAFVQGASGTLYFVADQSVGSPWDVLLNTGAGAITTTGFYHLVVTRKDGTWKIYVNNVLKDTVSGEDLIIVDNSTTYVGSIAGATSDFNGRIDELAFFSVELTTDNIAYLYNAGSPGSAQQYPFTTAADNAIFMGMNF